jgi:hypothetical protein
MSAQQATSPESLPLPTGEGVTIAPQIDVAAEEHRDESAFEPQDYDGASTASTSISSSVLEHEFHNGRRVRYISLRWRLFTYFHELARIPQIQGRNVSAWLLMVFTVSPLP